jgi:hypothetical protein
MKDKSKGAIVIKVESLKGKIVVVKDEQEVRRRSSY